MSMQLNLGEGAETLRRLGIAGFRLSRRYALKLIRSGTFKYLTAPGKMSQFGREAFQAVISGGYAAFWFNVSRWFEQIGPAAARRVIGIADSIPEEGVEMTDFNDAARLAVRSVASQLGTTAEAAGFDLAGPIAIGLSEWSQAKDIGERLGADTRSNHPIADTIHDTEKSLWDFIFGPHNPLARNPYSDDEPDPKRPKLNPVTRPVGDFSGLVSTFYNPVTSRIIGYKGISRKRKFSTLERYSPFWKEHNRLTQTSVLAGPS